MKKLRKLLCVGLCCVFGASVFSFTACGNKGTTPKESAPRVIVTGGEIEGEYVKTGTDSVKRSYNGVVAYKGIPYAASPIGENRWRAPQEVEPWDGIKECKEFGPSPIQPANDKAEGEVDYEIGTQPKYGYEEENCLTLNVWTNAKSTDKAMPVVFYVYGGAFVSGSNNVEIYNGEYLASQDVVVVSANYRVNIFGWFGCSALSEENSEGSAGNYGLMDLIKALDWCKTNISKFGGDPDKVTLFGGSAGGALINALMVSPKAQGLFKRAYSMSYPQDVGKTEYRAMAERNKAGDALIEKLGGLDAARSKSQEEILGLITANNLEALINAVNFAGPVQDGVYLDRGFVPALRNGVGKQIDFIIGVDHDPGNPSDADDRSFANMMGFDKGDWNKGDVLMTALNGIAKLRKEGGATNTYIMQYRHETPGPVKMGAAHGSDASYTLNYFSNERKEYWTENDYEMGNICSSYIINFAKTGNPNGKTVDGKDLTVWEKCEGDYKYFAINNTSKMIALDKSKISDIIAKFKESGLDFI